MTPGRDRLSAAGEATWPPARAWTEGVWMFRDGAGGGKRVSAATASGPVDDRALGQALAAFKRRGEAPLFRVGDGEHELDGRLAAAGLTLLDPVTVYLSPVGDLARFTAPPLSSVPSETPLAIQREIWAAGGIGAARLAVMARVAGRRTYLLGRTADSAAGTAFVALHDGIAMIHAIEVRPEARRRGTGRALILGAAAWAAERGGTHLALYVTDANNAANRLYAALGMAAVDRYHYRIGESPAA